MVTKFDHPDFVGGIVWSDCELRWINEKLAAAAELEHNYASLQQAFEEMKAIAAHRLAAMKEAESQRDTFASHGHRLALELECLLMDTKDLPTVSRWWYTGMSALTNWQNLFPYDGPRIGE